MRHEGFEATAAGDPVEIQTIGFGHKVMPGEQFGTLSRDEAVALLKADLASGVLPSLDAVEVALSQSQADALGSFVFNVGSGAFGGSTLLGKLNAGGDSAVPSELGRWVHADGSVLPGLVTRRANEGRLFREGIYR